MSRVRSLALRRRCDLRYLRIRHSCHGSSARRGEDQCRRSEVVMRIGVIFPQNQAGIGISGTHSGTPFGTDPVAVRDWAQAADDLGFDHIGLYEHIIGPDLARHPDLTGGYTNENTWHEPLVLCGYLAACTRRINFFTAILLLAMRQTVVTAKQAAEVDVLSGGRLRLGVGVGRVPFEYD